MCGICGQLSWGQKTKISSDVLSRMNRTLTHRGPDEDGFYTESFDGSAKSPPGAIGLAMRRLAVIDLSTGRQPIQNETGDVVVVYNGETYNFRELRDELTSLGHTFTTRSDTEVLVHGYEAWGSEMPSKLNGMFGFALWDRKKRRLLLGRDRIGIKPLYYAVLRHRLVFGSEIKAILEDPEVPREVDPLAVHDFLSMRYVPTPRSIYKAVRKLEPATLLIWEDGTVRFKKYWSARPRNGPSYSFKSVLEKTDALLQDAVRRQMISDVPLGTFLSGGIDSPTITYYAKKVHPDLKTFNIYFSDPSFSEREEARLVARHLGTQHIEMKVEPANWELIPKLVDVFDEPFADDSMIPTYFLTKLAREHMTVALSGDGGDELFAGYPTYLADRAATLYRSMPALFTEGVLQALVNRLPVSFDRISFDYKVKRFMRSAGRRSPLEHFGWTEIFDSGAKSSLYSKDFLSETRPFPLAESYVNAWADAGNRKGLERFLYVDQRTHLLDEFLVKVDRLSMAHSLEVRPPFLDHRLVEWAAEIPMKYKIRGVTLKVLLRTLMEKRLPRRILKGSKKGFSPPMAKWLALNLTDHVRKKFDPNRINDIPYFNPRAPRNLFEAHVAKRTNASREIWTLLMFVEWYDRKILNRIDR